VLEFKIQKLAYKKGIAAKALHLESSMMIGEFIEGVHKKRLSKKELRQLANVIKKLHSIKLIQRPIKFPSLIKIRAKKFKQELVLCHGDLSVDNILFGKTPKLLDWEYAGVQDKYFDLASACEAFKFSKAEENLFLKIYGGKIDKIKVKVYKEIFQILTKMWFKKLNRGKLQQRL